MERLRERLSAPAHTPRVRLALAALTSCMWGCGPRFHAAVARGGLLPDLLEALTGGDASERWPPELAVPAARAMASWADRVRGIPEFKAAAATLEASGVAPGDDGDFGAAVAAAAGAGGSPAGGAEPVQYATRGGIVVPLRANGGHVATADSSSNAAVQAALRVRGSARVRGIIALFSRFCGVLFGAHAFARAAQEAEAKTRAHVEEHLARVRPARPLTHPRSAAALACVCIRTTFR